MTDIAELGLAVRSDGVVVAKDRLRGMRSEANLADVAVAKLIRTAAGLVGAYASWQVVTAIMNKFVDNTIEAERVSRQLDTVIKSTGGSAGLTATQLDKMAKALQQVTTYDDEAIKSGEALLLTFTRVGGEIFPQATEAALDLSVAMGSDLNSAVLQVGKALNDPIAGLTALSRVGIQFSAEQKALIKGFMEQNDIMSAQKVILKELDTQFGGSARAARNTLGGALEALQGAFDDLFEVSGPGSEELRKSVEGLIKTISSPEFIRSVNQMGAALFEAFNKVLPVIIEIISRISRFFLEMDARANDPYLSTLKDHGDNAISFLSDRLSREDRSKKFSLAGKNTFGDMGEFFKPFQTPAEDSLAGTPGNSGRPGGLTEDQISEMEKLGEKYEDIIAKTVARADALKVETEAFKMGYAEGLVYLETQKLIAEAEEKGLSLTQDQIDHLTLLAEKNVDAQLTLEGLQMTLDNTSPWEKMIKQVEKLNTLLDRGKISGSAYATEIGKAAEEMVGTYAAGANDVLGNIEKLTDALGLEGKKAFEVQKALGIARAVVSGSEAIVHSFNAGAAIGGPPLGFVFAGIAAAATAAQIAAIASTTYQSKSVSSSGTSNAGTIPSGSEPVIQRRQGITVNLLGGGRYSKEEVRGLLTQINEEVSDGAELTVNSGN